MVEQQADGASGTASFGSMPDSKQHYDEELLAAFRPRDEQHAEEIRNAVDEFIRQIIANTTIISDESIRTINKFIAELDRRLTEQVNLIIHHPEFQKLEGSWRGLYYLVNNTETDQSLKIRCMNIKKEELSSTLEKFEGTAWDHSPIFRKIYTEEYAMLGGEPFGCLVGDFEFDNSDEDVATLGNVANICAAAHAPFIAAASPKLFNMNSWQEIMNPRDLTKIMASPRYAKWHSLREREDSRYIGLTMPRVLARLPWGTKTKPVSAFTFEEDVTGTEHDRYCWMNSAYAMAVNINRSFKEYGWSTMIRGVQSGGEVSNLPIHTFPTDDGGVAMKCPTEIAIDSRRDSELSSLGLMPLLHRKNTDLAAFLSAQSLQLPGEYNDPDATANAQLSARLPYLFAVSRFAHYLKKMVQDKIGLYKERRDMQRDLQEWISGYVDGDPDNSTIETKAKYPLRYAEVAVEEVPGNPGYYKARFYLRPHYQLDRVDINLCLVSKLPSVKMGG